MGPVVAARGSSPAEPCVSFDERGVVERLAGTIDVEPSVGCPTRSSSTLPSRISSTGRSAITTTAARAVVAIGPRKSAEPALGAIPTDATANGAGAHLDIVDARRE